MSEPEWLEPSTVIELNELIVGSTGEPFQVRDAGLLESALGRPYANWAYGGEADIVSLAISLIFALARNHPFAQGNKRTAFEAGVMFLQANGYDWLGPDDVEIAERMIAVIERKAELSFFADLFEIYVVPKDQLDPDQYWTFIKVLTQLREFMAAEEADGETGSS